MLLPETGQTLAFLGHANTSTSFTSVEVKSLLETVLPDEMNNTCTIPQCNQLTEVLLIKGLTSKVSEQLPSLNETLFLQDLQYIRQARRNFDLAALVEL